MNELVKFYQSLMQEVVAMQSGDEDGNTQEQVFRRPLPTSLGKCE